MLKGVLSIITPILLKSDEEAITQLVYAYHDLDRLTPQISNAATVKKFWQTVGDSNS